MHWSSTEARLALGATAILVLGVASLACAEEGDGRQRFDATALAAWPVWGAGAARLDADAAVLTLREGADSLGVNLVSPDPLPRHLRARLRVKPLREEGVLVVILSAAPTQGGPLRPPEGYRGEQSFWKAGDVASYAFAFHTGYHQPNAFAASNPGWNRLVEVPDVATGERWYEVEVGRGADRLWLRIDGEEVFDVPVPDPPGLPGGRLALRLRGPGDGSFATQVAWIEVEPLPDAAPAD